MAAPQYVANPAVDDTRSYSSPTHVPDAWHADRPGDLEGRQPRGARLGNPGPDQGYALLLAKRIRSRIVVQPDEHVDDAVQGCLGIALRRASIFGRAPVMHDFTLAFTIWGFFDANPPADLLAERMRAFEGVAHVAQHYTEARALADRVPEPTLRLTPQQAAAAYPAQWRSLVG